MPFGGLVFSASFHPLTTPKKWFFCRFFSFLAFVPRITPLQIELRSRKLVPGFSISPRCTFDGFRLFSIIATGSKNALL